MPARMGKGLFKGLSAINPEVAGEDPLAMPQMSD